MPKRRVLQVYDWTSTAHGHLSQPQWCAVLNVDSQAQNKHAVALVYIDAVKGDVP